MNPLRVNAAIVGILFASVLAVLAQSLLLPARPASALPDQAFAESIKVLSSIEREECIFDDFLVGHVPEFLRQLAPIANRISLNGQAMLSGTEDDGHGYAYSGARICEKWLDAP